MSNRHHGDSWTLDAEAPWVMAVALVARSVPADGTTQQSVPIRSEFAALRSGRLWLALAACATTTGGVLAAYSFASPLLTDRAGIPAGWVPVVLVGFGVRTLIGTVVGGRLGDHHPHPTTNAVPAASAVVLLAVCLVSAHPAPTVVLVVLLGLVGLSANPVLTSFAVRYAATAPTLASSPSVAAFNAGTAIGTWIAGRTLDSALGAAGPAVVGATIELLPLVPVLLIARVQRHRETARR